MNSTANACADQQERALLVTRAMLRATRYGPNSTLEASELRELSRMLAVAAKSAREMRRALALREAAIDEAHHRAKNTLQIAASILSLHARATASEEVRVALNDSRARLQVLAKAHELLYVNGSDAQSILMPSLLGALGDALRQSFPEASQRVELTIAVEELRLPADAAIAAALLTNEAITNAYKHAFPNQSCGAISVSLALTADDTLTLRTIDDGVGMPPSSAEGGIGLQLMRAFAAQLGGVLTISTGPAARGAAVTLTIRPASKLAQPPP